MACAPRILHSHTHALRLASGAEALVVRVRIEGGATGFGFTFTEDVAAARAMARWLAAPGDAATRRALRAAAPPDAHPWARDWRAVLAGRQSAIDWDAEPGFAGLRWIDAAPNQAL
ncbi:MAG TPA: hypothetical protein VIS77_06440 [Burkholderiales bacterium]